MKSTSLRVQISYRILLLSCFIMIIGGAIAVWQARNAVAEEVDSSINLALQLVNLGFSTRPNPDINEHDWIYRLTALKQTRHLRIQLKMPSGKKVTITGSQTKNIRHADSPPQWFIDLVRSEYPKAEHQIKTLDGKTLTLIIQANPMDEITEVWKESIAFFITICLLVLLTFVAVHLVFKKAFQAIDTIVDTLKWIETGEYRKKLPQFYTLEYDSIARAINHMTDVLEKTRQQNRALTQHSLQIQEEERRRLSQELHDELGQSLTAIKVMSATATHKQANVPEIMQSITQICDHLMHVVRSMMQQLHPLMLSELGLKATLEDLINHWKERNAGLSVSFFCADKADSLNDVTTIQIYRVIQEALTNISRHANASLVTVYVQINDEQPETLTLQISDNGSGCHLEQIYQGFGLLSMNERIKSLDGDISVHSSPGQGMRIDIKIPIK